MQSPTARLCGRTGPKNMPWPFNGKKTREEAQVSTGMSVEPVYDLRVRLGARVTPCAASASPASKSIPPEARGVPKKVCARVHIVRLQ
jgi:hypothetical protein